MASNFEKNRHNSLEGVLSTNPIIAITLDARKENKCV